MIGLEQITLDELLFDKLPKQLNLESQLWETADDLRANAGLKSNEYATPLLGLIFLKYATNRFESIRAQGEKEYQESLTGRSDKTQESIFRRLCGFVLPDTANYNYLLNLKNEDNAQKAVINALEAFEKANPQADVVLPKNDYYKIPDAVLKNIIVKFSEIKAIDGDAFGKIYEYFLGKFALSEGQKGGEFYTPTSVVKLIVEIIEPQIVTGDECIFDPACGTGGMFVQSAKFVKQHQQRNIMSIYGQEQVANTATLSRLNLFVNGLKGEIRSVSSSLSASVYSEKGNDVLGRFSHVMANPPFNVDGVKVEDVANHPLFSAYGLPLNIAKTGKKSETFSSSAANYLWISLFATALNDTGRAGFVMANSASDARGREAEIRQKMIESGIVDVMVSVSSNFFYTVTLPVTLWFFDKGKAKDSQRKDKTLFIDARKIFNQISRSQREFTQAQLLNINAIVWLYRGENHKFLQLLEVYKTAADMWRNGGILEMEDPDKSKSDNPRLAKGEKYLSLSSYYQNTVKAFNDLGQAISNWFKNIALTDEATQALSENDSFADTITVLQNLTHFKDKTQLNEYFKQAEAVVTFAEKTLKPKNDKSFGQAEIKTTLRDLANERRLWLFVSERIAYFEAQAEWLNHRFPDATWCDVEGLCKIADITEIAEQNYSLNPGRYVGVAIEDDGMTEAEFQDFLNTQAQTLKKLSAQAQTLHTDIETDILSLASALITEGA